ncbi:MAG TPA: Gfo/Idh/MocA family oxidoreductase, partial [Gemmataceae bacterium]|nr:Gfo/Idh/MocA family oxidoreductase [Gemmataceae bacterium]
MPLDMTPEQREIGKANFAIAANDQMNRRTFLKGMLATGATAGFSAAGYFGYKEFTGKPLKVGLIGAGDEGGVLVGSHNPEYLQFVAYSDIRPSNKKRIFEGEPTGPRLGFNRIYGQKEAAKIKWYEKYQDLLQDKDIEAVVIALPLCIHAQVAIDAMAAGKHVLCEKLMARTVKQCKDMIAASRKHDRILTVGHQRHYSLLYAQASDILKSGMLGDLRFIRAWWHRNNSWPALDKYGKQRIDPLTKEPLIRDSWYPDIKDEDKKALENRLKDFKVGKFTYKDMLHLVRWRLYNETGAGLMAELGSHQLDACSIFLGDVHPLAVSGVGTRSFYREEYKRGLREVDDQIFATFEFPGPNYWADESHKTVKDKDDVVVVTYSSTNTSAFEGYGECVLGSRGTMIVDGEKEVMLYPERNPNKPIPGAPRNSLISIAAGSSAATPVVDSSGSTGGP